MVRITDRAGVYECTVRLYQYGAMGMGTHRGGWGFLSPLAWLPRWVCPPRRRVLLPPLTCLPALHDAMNPAMMNPDMMKAAQDMMSKMSPEDMQKMMKMQQQMCAPP